MEGKQRTQDLFKCCFRDQISGLVLFYDEHIYIGKDLYNEEVREQL